MRRGVALVEVVVAALVVAALLSLFLPALRGSRERAREVIDFSNLRQHAGVAAVYANDFYDSNIFVTNPSQSVVLDKGLIGYTPVATYFGASDLWPYSLAMDYYALPANAEIFLGPDADDPLLSRYFLTCTVLADHAYWNQSSRIGPSQWGSTNFSDTVFPSAKVHFTRFLWKSTFARQGSGVQPVVRSAFFDGHASSASLWRLGSYLGDGPREWKGTMHHSDERAGLHTIDGLAGRDK